MHLSAFLQFCEKWVCPAQLNSYQRVNFFFQHLVRLFFALPN